MNHEPSSAQAGAETRREGEIPVRIRAIKKLIEALIAEEKNILQIFGEEVGNKGSRLFTIRAEIALYKEIWVGWFEEEAERSIQEKIEKQKGQKKG